MPRPRLLVIGLLMSGLLALNAATVGADNRGTTIKHLRAQVKQLTQQRNAARSARDALIVSLRETKADVKTSETAVAQSQTDLASRTTERDAALASLTATQAQLVAAQQGGLAAVLTQAPDGLWESMRQIWLVIPNSSLCGYSKTVYSSGNYTSYDFVRYIC